MERRKAKIRTRHRNGTEIIAEVNSTRITDETGKTTGYVVTYRDVTDRKRMEEAFAKQHEELQTIFDTVPHQSSIKIPRIDFYG